MDAPEVTSAMPDTGNSFDLSTATQKRALEEIPSNLVPTFTQQSPKKRRTEPVSPLLGVSSPESRNQSRRPTQLFVETTPRQNTTQQRARTPILPPPLSPRVQRASNPTSNAYKPRRVPPPIQRPYRTLTKATVSDCQKQMLVRELTRSQQMLAKQDDEIRGLQVQLETLRQRARVNPEHKQQILQLREHLSALESECAGLRVLVGQRDSEKEILAQSLDEHHEKLKEVKNVISDLQLERDSFNHQVELLRSEVDSLRSELAGEREGGKELVHEKEELLSGYERQQEELMQRLEEAEHARETIIKQRDAALADFEALRAASMAAEKERDTFAAKLDEVEAEMKSTHNQTMEFYEAKVQKLVDALQAAQSQAEAQSEQHEVELNKLRSVLVEAKEALQGKERERQALESKLELLLNEKEVLASSNSRLRDIEQENERLRSELSVLHRKQIELQEEVDAGNSRYEQLNQAYVDCQLELTTVLKSEQANVEAARLEKVEELKTVYRNSLDEMLSQRSADIEQIDMLNDELVNLREQLSDAHIQIQELNTEKLNAALQVGTNPETDVELEKCSRELAAERDYIRRLQNEIQDLKGNIRLVARVRPPAPDTPLSDLSLSATTVVLSQQTPPMYPGASAKVSRLESKFDRVFGPDASNASVAEETDYLVQSAIEGRVVSILAYGQTGSGKSFTMNSKDGVIPHALELIMDAANKQSAQFRTEVSVEAVEIYNECLADLLKENPVSSPRRVKPNRGNEVSIRTDMATGVLALEGATRTQVYTVEGALLVLSRALRHRSTSSTAANEVSSRSHFVFSVHIDRTPRSNTSALTNPTHGVLHLVDLAGSERLSESKVTGIHVKEATSINKSLTTLKQVIGSLRSDSKGVQSRGAYHTGAHTGAHYTSMRDSKLTMLLQGSFRNDAKTMLMLMLSPSLSSREETKNTLRFANDASNAVLR